MADPALNVRTYICHCTRQTNVAANDPAMPAGWELRTVRKYDGGSYETALCDDCVAFENSLFPAEVDVLDGRSPAGKAFTDRLSHILTGGPPPDDAGDLDHKIRKRKLWQVVMTFHTDKGAVESPSIVIADDPVAAIEANLKVIETFKRTELVSINITPAPVFATNPSSAADRTMRPKRHIWPIMGMHG